LTLQKQLHEEESYSESSEIISEPEVEEPIPNEDNVITDQYVPSRKIIRSADPDSNLCMFYALFNSLRQENLRMAFAGI
jgi:hypothetical protein